MASTSSHQEQYGDCSAQKRCGFSCRCTPAATGRPPAPGCTSSGSRTPCTARCARCPLNYQGAVSKHRTTTDRVALLSVHLWAAVLGSLGPEEAFTEHSESTALPLFQLQLVSC